MCGKFILFLYEGKLDYILMLMSVIGYIKYIGSFINICKFVLNVLNMI